MAEVTENSSGGQTVAEVRARDPDEDSLTHHLEGPDASVFSMSDQLYLVGAFVQPPVLTRSGVDYDYETKKTYDLTVVVEDGFGGTDRVDLLVRVVDTLEPPGKVALTAVAAPAGIVGALTVTWAEPDNTGPPILGYDIEYRIGTGDWFQLPRQQGTQAMLNHLMPNTTYAVKVRAVNEEGDGEFSDEREGLTGDGAALTLVVNPAALDEGGKAIVKANVDMMMAVRYTVAVAGPPSETARYEFVGGHTTLTFEPNETSSTEVEVQAVQNDADDGDVVIRLTGRPNTTSVGGATATLTIRDDDDPAVTVTVPQLVSETGHLFESENDETAHMWTVERSGLLDQALEVQVTPSETTGGDADFVAAAAEGMAHTLTFKANDATVTYTPVVADDVDESHGSVTVTVEAGTGYRVDPRRGFATVAVRDDDGTRLVNFTLAPLDVELSEGRTVELDAVLQTVGDSTFTQPRDLGRVLDLAASGGGLALSFDTVDVEAVGTGAYADFTAVSRGRDDRAAEFAGDATGLTATYGLPGIATISDADETEIKERFIVTLARGASAPTSLYPATRADVTDLLGPMMTPVRLSGSAFIASVVELRDAPLLTLLVEPNRILEGDSDVGEGTATVSATTTNGSPRHIR